MPVRKKKTKPTSRKSDRRSAQTHAPSRAKSVPAPTGWKWHRRGGLQILQASGMRRIPQIMHGFSTRVGGASKLGNKSALNLGFTEWDKRESVEENREEFSAALGANDMTLIALKQIHSDVIHRVDDAPAEPLRGDALVTNTPGLLLSVQTADCVPILLADKRGRTIAAVHAGWRGTLARILAKTVGRMQMEFGTKPSEIFA